jgi:hypothetical protein
MNPRMEIQRLTLILWGLVAHLRRLRALRQKVACFGVVLHTQFDASSSAKARKGRICLDAGILPA